MVLGGLMVGKADINALLGRFQSRSHFLHSARIVGRYALDRLKGYGRGTRLVMGNALVAQLLFSLTRAGVNVVYGARCQNLLRQEGRVTGALMQHQGTQRAYHARVGVVLCAGGIGHHPQMRRAFGAEALGSQCLTFEGTRGEGIDAARAVGGALERGVPDFLWQPVSKVPRTQNHASSLYPHLFLDRAKPGLIAVNRAGRRFVNEGASYHHFVEGMRQASETTAPFALLT
ncbi:FAD-binding protein [Delftia tsuruhatensis]